MFPLLLLLLAGTGPLTVTDDLGRAVTLPAPATRIVSLAPSITETLFALGAQDRIAGVTDYCNHPPAATRLPRVGGMINPSIETIVRLRPDLVILSVEGNLREDFRRLEELGIPLFVTNPRTLDDIGRSIRQLGALTGRDSAAAAVVAEMNAEVTRIAAPVRALAERRALLAVSLQPLIAAGSTTYLNDLLTRAGAVNIAADAGGTYPQFSREAVVLEDPDVIFVLSDAVASTDEVLQLIPEWRTLRAVRTGNLKILNADLLSRPGPRAADALRELHRGLYDH
jgi:iron complex transport system substrate-binding protein